MISQLTEGETELFEKLKPNHYARRIRSHFAAYSIKYDFARFYVLRRGEQAVTLISIFNAAMMCADITGQSLTAAEVEELAHFILMNSPYSVELDPRYASVIVERFRAACPNAPISVLRDGQELPYEAVLTI